MKKTGKKILSFLLLFMALMMVRPESSYVYATDAGTEAPTDSEPETNEGNEPEENDDDETEEDIFGKAEMETKEEDVDLSGYFTEDKYINSNSFDIKVEGTGNASDDLQSALYGFLSILEGAAAVAFIFALGKLFLSFKDDKPDEKVQASMIILASILLFSLEQMIKKIINKE